MNSYGCQRAADNSFGPLVASCARSFDFTLLFEQAVLSIIPSAVFLLLSPWRAWSLRVSTEKTTRGWLSIAKPITILLLIISQLVLLIYYTKPNIARTTMSIPAAALALSVAIAIIPLSHLEQYRSVRPSTLLNSYLALSIILDLPQARTLYLIPGQLHPAAIFSAALAVKIALLLFEAWNKRDFLVQKYQALATETTSGIFSSSLFLWMNNLFKRGYSKVISFEDLGPIDDRLASARLHHQVQDVWTRQDRQIRWPLVRSLWKALRWSILSPIPPRLCYSGFLFAQPFLINRATTYLSQPKDALKDDIGYGLVGAAACIYLGIAISNALFKHQLYRHITMVRASLVSLIYTQSLSIEDRIDDPSAAVTLMSTDVDRICQSLALLHDLWSRPLELVIGVSLLALQIGWVSVMPVAVVLISALLDSRVTILIGSKVKVWTDAVQRRISLTADVLSSMKSVKMLGLAQPLHMLLQKERLYELSLQVKFRWSTVWLNTLGNLPPALTAAVTFTTYAIKAHVTGSGNLDISQVFTSLALISLVTTPASELISAFPSAASCFGCLERVQAHLMKPRRHDSRDLTNTVEKAEINDHQPPMLAAYLSHVDISMADSPNLLLRSIDLDIRQNSFTIIQGPIGSGKSTLLRAMLGDVQFSGTISIGVNRMAYCPQIPWLFTGTIRQNICCLEVDAIDEAWYKSVLQACALDRFLLALPQGDSTHIEGQSSSLSGGQKQRVILARALYHRPQLILLDDILSALDIKTERQIMTRLFGAGGLLSRLGAAVVLVTHTKRWESVADKVVTLDGSGNATQYSNTARSSTEFLSPDAEPPNAIEVSTESDTSGIELVDSEVNQASHPSVADSKLDGDAVDYVYYFKSVRWPLAVMFLFFAAAQTVCFYMSQVILNWWATDHGLDETKWLPTYIILAIGNGVLYGFTLWIMFLKIVPESSANLHRILLDAVMSAPHSFFTGTDVGTVLNRFSQDMTLIESQLPTGALCTLIYFFWMIGSLALISLGSTWMALTLPVVFFTLFFVQRVYLRTSRRLRTIELELRSPMYSHFMGTLRGLSSIRTLKWEDQFTSAMIQKLDRSQVPYYLLYCSQRWLQLVLDSIVTALAIVVMMLAVKVQSSAQPGSLGLSLNNILSFNEILTILLQFWTQLEVSLGAIARTRDFSDQTPSEPKPVLPTSPSKDWPNQGGIEIRNLSAHYTTTNIALDNITMSIRPGEKVGVCGRSGSGKSSLLSAMLRLVEPSNSTITIDGVDICSLHQNTVRERLLAIPQDAFLLQHTVRFNLDPLAEYSDAQMITALSKASLWSSIERRRGLDAFMTSDFLSQGQKQLFSLARAILRKEKRRTDNGQHISGGVLLLDEATSNIDLATDTLMQRVIKDEFSTYTKIVVAHRLDTILDSDRIAVLDAGRLVEFDSPQELLSRDSMFSALYRVREEEMKP